MISFNSNCCLSQNSTWSQENTFISYAENQICNQEIPTNTICNILKASKSPITKQNETSPLIFNINSNVKTNELAFLQHPISESTVGIYSNTDIIYPFHYFW